VGISFVNISIRDNINISIIENSMIIISRKVLVNSIISIISIVIINSDINNVNNNVSDTTSA
jgi:hypothetical protein